MIVPKCAGPKRLPEAVMTQLDFRAEPNVPRQQAEHGRTRHLLKCGDQFDDPRTSLAIQLRQQVLQPENIRVEESLEVAAGGADSMRAEAFAHERRIRATREIQPFSRSRDFELAGTR